MKAARVIGVSIRSRVHKLRNTVLLLGFCAAAPALANDFGACVGKLRKEAVAKGIAAQTFDTALSGIEADQTVLDALDRQPEFTTPIWDYLAGLVDEQRVADGRA